MGRVEAVLDNWHDWRCPAMTIDGYDEYVERIYNMAYGLTVKYR